MSLLVEPLRLPSRLPPEPGLVLWLPMSIGSGDLVYDHSGLGNHGTRMGATWVPGRYNYGMYFNGAAEDHVLVPHHPSLSLDTVSVEAWVYITQTDIGTQGVIVQKSDGTKHNYNLAYEGRPSPPVPNTYRKFLFTIWDGSVTVALYSNTLAIAGRWYHLVGMRDAETDMLYIYINGQYDNSTADTTTADIKSTGDVRIGRHFTSGFAFTGIIDEPRIYSRILTPEEIRMHYHLRQTPLNPLKI